MNEGTTKLQQYIRRNPVIVAIFVVLQLIFVIFLVTAIHNLNANTYKTPNIQISGLSEQLKELPSSSANNIENVLYGMVAKNRGAIHSISDSDAAIREGTLVNLYFEDIDMHYINFIVDIPSIEQSYQVFAEWSDDNANVHYLVDRTALAFCLPESQAIYESFDCQDGSIYQNQGQSFIVSEFINHFAFDHFSVYVDTDDPSRVNINPINFDISTATRESYIRETKEAIASLGISPDIFTYKVLQQSDLDYNIPAKYR